MSEEADKIEEQDLESNEGQEAGATEGPEKTKTFTHSSFFPGMFEIIFFLGVTGVMTVLNGMITKGDLKINQGDGVVVVGLLMFVFFISLFVIGRRHKKRLQTVKDYPRTVRIRDLAILSMSVMFANLASAGLSSQMSQFQQVGMFSLICGFISIALFSKTWSILGGSKSMLWGGAFVLASLLNVYFLTKTTSALWTAIEVFEPKGEILGVFSALLNPLFFILSFLLQAVAFAFGGMGLFKDREERGSLELQFLVYYKYSLFCLGLGTLFMAFSSINDGFDNPKFIEQLMGNMGFSIALFYFIVGNRMKKHYREAYSDSEKSPKKMDTKIASGIFAVMLLSIGLGFAITERTFASTEDSRSAPPTRQINAGDKKPVLKNDRDSKKIAPGKKPALAPGKGKVPSKEK
jgi:hypothetical protein